MIKKIHMLGLSSVLKPKIVLEVLSDMNAFHSTEIEYLTDSETGLVVDYCRAKGISVVPVNHKNINESIQDVKKRGANLLICVGWDKKLPEEFMAVYDNCINCHGGLLPDYRGNRAYMPLYANIPDEYGVTIHYMTSEFDDGNIIMQAKLKLYLEETPLIIHRRLCELTGLILPESVRLVQEGYKGIVQTGKARFFSPLTRQEMEELRQRNVENLRKGLPKEVSPHKAWDLS